MGNYSLYSSTTRVVVAKLPKSAVFIRNKNRSQDYLSYKLKHNGVSILHPLCIIWILSYSCIHKITQSCIDLLVTFLIPIGRTDYDCEWQVFFKFAIINWNANSLNLHKINSPSHWQRTQLLNPQFSFKTQTWNHTIKPVTWYYGHPG